MIRCLIVDDEPLAVAQCARFLSRIPEVEIVDRCLSIDAARQALDRERVDLIFLDISMPGCSGIEFALSLGDKAPIIVFVTAHPQFALEGFKIGAVHYLTKPLAFDDLVVAVDRARALINSAATQAEESRHIMVKSKGEVRRVLIDDIVYIKGLSEYVQLRLRDQRNYLTILDSIKRFEEELADERFMRIHKSYLINLDYISSANRFTVKLRDEELPIGNKYKTEFREYINSNVSK